MTVRVSPITDSDLRRVAEFIHTHHNRRLSADAWARSLVVPWQIDAPNRGFMLVDDDAIVGVYLAFYSQRMINGRLERFCNLGTWKVLPDYRMHSLRLLKALLAQDGYHFTDLTPIRGVQRVNSRFKFRSLDTTVALMPNLPWPARPGRDVISSDPELIERTLTGPDLELYRDHAAAKAARHLVLIRGDDWCYVMLRKVRRRNLPLFALILHVSNPPLFQAMARPLARHLLLHHRALATLAELRVVTHRPHPSLVRKRGSPKMYRSSDLQPSRVDYLYSELTCVPF